VVARNLGHADTRMVEKHYGHMAPSYIVEAIHAGAPRLRLIRYDGCAAAKANAHTVRAVSPLREPKDDPSYASDFSVGTRRITDHPISPSRRSARW
jgi:hypothetical protein